MTTNPLLDLFEIEDLLSKEQQMIRDSVRKYSGDVSISLVQVYFHEEVIPKEYPIMRHLMN